MRQYGPDGKKHPPTAYVFGDEVGTCVKTVTRAWRAAVLRAHGYKPEYVVKIIGDGKEARQIRTGSLTSDSRARLRDIDLHFHDLRREAGSRWLDGGVPLTKIQQWLGHTTVAQTSTYLMADASDDHDAMRRFEMRRAELQRIAMESGNGHHNPPQSTTTHDSEPPVTTENLH